MTPAEFRATRTQLGLSRRELAQLLDVTVQSIKDWEVGRSPIRRVTELALAWIVTCAWILCETVPGARQSTQTPGRPKTQENGNSPPDGPQNGSQPQTPPLT